MFLVVQVVGTADTCATAASRALSWVRSSSYSALPSSPWERGFSGIFTPPSPAPRQAAYHRENWMLDSVLWIRITSMWIWIRLVTPIRIRILFFIWCGSGFLFDPDWISHLSTHTGARAVAFLCGRQLQILKFLRDLLLYLHNKTDIALRITKKQKQNVTTFIFNDALWRASTLTIFFFFYKAPYLVFCSKYCMLGFFAAVFRIRGVLIPIRSADPTQRITDPDPTLFFSGFQDANRK